MKKAYALLFVAFSLLTITSCTKKDKCETTICRNGGTCYDGSCTCPTGYTGSDCSTQKTPTQILISKIVVTGFPATTSNGAGWDLTDGPDIFPRFFISNTLAWSSTLHYSNCTNSYQYEFVPAQNIVITNTLAQCNVSLYDWDGVSADDPMTGRSFYPYSTTGGFPTTLNFTNIDGFKVTLYVSYVF